MQRPAMLETNWRGGVNIRAKFIIYYMIYIYIYIWVNYNDLTATSLEIMVHKGNHPKLALIQVSEIL